MKILKLVVLVALTVLIVESNTKRQKQVHNQRKLKAKKQQAEGGDAQPAAGGGGGEQSAGGSGDQAQPATGPVDTSVTGTSMIPPANAAWQQDADLNYLPSIHDYRGFNGIHGGQLPIGPNHPMSMTPIPNVYDNHGRHVQRNSFIQAIKKIKERENKLKQIEYIQNKERELDMREQRVKDRLAGNDPFEDSYMQKQLKKKVVSLNKSKPKKY